ncbi:hypothetical protein OF83DRAFT_1159781 [Amylostereum chailletii]|nr:hypothetical protein OF83DRAFT_1159781 [Amylostereum chailletii]
MRTSARPMMEDSTERLLRGGPRERKPTTARDDDPHRGSCDPRPQTPSIRAYRASLLPNTNISRKGRWRSVGQRRGRAVILIMALGLHGGPGSRTAEVLGFVIVRRQQHLADLKLRNRTRRTGNAAGLARGTTDKNAKRRLTQPRPSSIVQLSSPSRHALDTTLPVRVKSPANPPARRGMQSPVPARADVIIMPSPCKRRRESIRIRFSYHRSHRDARLSISRRRRRPLELFL